MCGRLGCFQTLEWNKCFESSNKILYTPETSFDTLSCLKNSQLPPSILWNGDWPNTQLEFRRTGNTILSKTAHPAYLFSTDY